MAVLLIIVVVAAILFFIAKIKAEARMTAVDTRRAIRAVETGAAETMPTWSVRETESLIFFDGVRKMAERKGVPKQYIHTVFSEREPARMLLLAAGEMETEGRSFTQQQLGVTELLSSMWNRLPSQNKVAPSTAPQINRGVQTVYEHVIQSYSTLKPIRFRPVVEQDIHGLFEAYAAIIPSKCALNEVGLIRLGFITDPKYGALIVCAALMGDEAWIHCPGGVPVEQLSDNREGLQQFQEEEFARFWAIVQSEIAQQDERLR